MQAGEALRIDEPTVHREWLEVHEQMFREMANPLHQNLARWFQLFRPALTETVGRRVIVDLEKARGTLAGLKPSGADAAVCDRLARIASVDLSRWISVAELATGSASFFGKLSPRRIAARRKVRRWLSRVRRTADDTELIAFRDAAMLESTLRVVRDVVQDVRAKLGLAANDIAPERLEQLRATISALLVDVSLVAAGAAAVYSYPLRHAAEQFARAGTLEAFDAFVASVRRGLARYEARTKSAKTLRDIDEWLDMTWAVGCADRIDRDTLNGDIVRRVGDALPTLAPFQQFRARATQLPPTALEAFAALRSVESALATVSPDNVAGEVRRVIDCEARLAWKARLEAAEPSLLVEPAETELSIRALATDDARLRQLNRELLAGDPPTSEVAASGAWEDLTRLRGPRARRLREVFERGVELGLLRLRPVWLMNPDVASRLLPLRPLFDVVVFDEASQLPVEFAVPALFRARRAIISGDEKQMPPTGFFLSHIDSDETGDVDEDAPEDGVTDAERTHLEEAWNRREIKDCPDVLTLARAVLPSTMLEIHYRSKYRELHCCPS